jgi:hypothetical protein
MIREYFPENFKEFLSKELNFTLVMIRKNLSNFSAWHYRSKLIPIHFKFENKFWSSQEAMDFFKLDLELITNAVYTDPKDQSPWTYHLWIINNLTPVYVEHFEIKGQEVFIKFSEILKWKDLIHTKGNNLENVEIYSENNNQYSNSIVIRLLKNGGENVNISLTGKAESNFNSDSKVCFSKNNLSLPVIDIEFSSNSIPEINVKITNSDFAKHHLEFLESQIKMINELIKNSESGFLEYAHFRKSQIYNILYHLVNQFIDTTEGKNYKSLVLAEYAILKTNSKRMKTMYEEFALKLKSGIYF